MKNFSFLFFSLLLCFNCEGQTIGISKQDTLNYYELENLKNQKLAEIYVKSDAVILPDSINIILKEFALKNNYNELSVLKNAIFLKPLYNKSISIIDRLYIADYLLNLFSKPMSLLPLNLIEGIKLKIANPAK